VLRYFAALGFGDIELRAIPKLPGTQILSDAPNAVLEVIAFETERFSVLANAAKCNMNVWVIGIEVRDCSPLEARIEIPRHTLHQVAGQLRQVDLVSELRRHDDLPHAFIAGRLPLVQTSGNIDPLLGGVKPSLNSTALAGALAGDVASVRPPLPARGILCVHDAHSAPLLEGARRNRAPRPRLALLCTQFSDIAKNQEVGRAPSSG